jgi:hypothetical protein
MVDQLPPQSVGALIGEQASHHFVVAYEHSVRDADASRHRAQKLSVSPAAAHPFPDPRRTARRTRGKKPIVAL